MTDQSTLEIRRRSIVNLSSVTLWAPLVHYRKLPHYFFKFDLYNKDAAQFLDLATRLRTLDGTGLHTVPVLHRGPATAEKRRALIGPSAFDSAFENPVTSRTDHLMEGLYVRTEAGGHVTGRAKMVQPEFVEKVNKASTGSIKRWCRMNSRKRRRFGRERIKLRSSRREEAQTERAESPTDNSPGQAKPPWVIRPKEIKPCRGERRFTSSL